MRTISLGIIARSLDVMLDGQMTGQARIAAHFVAAAEAAGLTPDQIISIIDTVVENTVLDEIWISDEEGHAYLTNARTEEGDKVPFTFNPDPAVQPQASKFYPLLSESPDSDAVIVQEAQNREIDWEIFKYVGVSGVDRKRIVQVGNALAFEEQGLLSDTYSSPVMTAVLAAFGEFELLDARSTSRTPEVRSVFEAILMRQMAVQCTLIDAFVQNAEAAGWSASDICGRLHRIVTTTPLGEMYVASHNGKVTHSSVESPPETLPRLDAIGRLEVGQMSTTEHAWESADDRTRKAVTVFHPGSNRLVQVVEYFEDTALVSPRYVIPM